MRVYQRPVHLASLSHTAIAMRDYAQAMRRDEHHVAQLTALIEGC